MTRVPSHFPTLRHFPALVFSLVLPFSYVAVAEETGSDGKPSIEDQLADLRAAVARVEAALAQEQQALAESSSSHEKHEGHNSEPKKEGMGMMEMKKGMGQMSGGGGMMGHGGMKGMDGMMKGMGGMSGMSSSSGDPQSSSGMQMGMMQKGGMMKGMGMMMMGKTPDSSMAESSLPGFPGASHIYHIGASDFFLNHREHLGLNADQQKQLNEFKSDTLLKQNEFDRQLERAEEQLWVLTSESEPDGEKIQNALAEIGVLTAEKRLDFIRSVGAAAEVLTEGQRALLVGESSEGESDPSHDDHQHEEQANQ